MSSSYSVFFLMQLKPQKERQFSILELDYVRHMKAENGALCTEKCLQIIPCIFLSNTIWTGVVGPVMSLSLVCISLYFICQKSSHRFMLIFVSLTDINTLMTRKACAVEMGNAIPVLGNHRNLQNIRNNQKTTKTLSRTFGLLGQLLIDVHN